MRSSLKRWRRGSGRRRSKGAKARSSLSRLPRVTSSRTWPASPMPARSLATSCSSGSTATGSRGSSGTGSVEALGKGVGRNGSGGRQGASDRTSVFSCSGCVGGFIELEAVSTESGGGGVIDTLRRLGCSGNCPASQSTSASSRGPGVSSSGLAWLWATIQLRASARWTETGWRAGIRSSHHYRRHRAHAVLCKGWNAVDRRQPHQGMAKRFRWSAPRSASAEH